jgi:hypothetical protein
MFGGTIKMKMSALDTIGWKSVWIEALRSGKYRQCKRVLRNSNGEHCALGVLADTDWYKERTVPLDILLSPDEYDSIIELNDWKDMDFHQIADYIEENL